MKTYTHRIVQILAGLAGVSAGTGQIVTDPHDLAGWMALITGAVVAVVTFYRQVTDPTTPTLPPAAP